MPFPGIHFTGVRCTVATTLSFLFLPMGWTQADEVPDILIDELPPGVADTPGTDPTATGEDMLPMLVDPDDLSSLAGIYEEFMPEEFRIPPIDVRLAEGHRLQPAQMAALERDFPYWLSRGLQQARANDLNAVHNLANVLSSPVVDELKQDAMRELGLLYLRHGQLGRGIMTLEKYRETYSLDDSLPLVLLTLGQTYRSIGAFDLALERFFNVPQAVASLQLGGKIDEATRLAELGTFNVALTYFIKGDYQEARRVFRRIQRIGGTREQTMRAAFYSAQCEFLLGNYRLALMELERFVERHPNSPFLAEARYLIARCQQIMGNRQEALQTVLTLLERESLSQSYDPANWIYWQRKVGNQLANEFYEHGEYHPALEIYQNLVRLSPEVSWQWPIVYQIGLTFERLKRPERAMEAYQYILEQDREISTDSLSKPLQEIVRLARWRASKIDWTQNTKEQLQQFLPGEPASQILFPETAARNDNRPSQRR